MLKKTDKSTSNKQPRSSSLKIDSTRNSSLNPIPLLIAIMVFLVSVGWYWYVSGDTSMSQKSEVADENRADVTPRPSSRPILQGKEIYQVSQAEDLVGPQTRSVEINPHDPKVGEKQTLVVTTAYDAGVKSINVKLMSDGDEQEMSLSQVSEEGTLATWKGEWMVTQPVLYQYILEFTLEGADGASNVLPITIRGDI